MRIKQEASCSGEEILRLVESLPLLVWCWLGVWQRFAFAVELKRNSDFGVTRL